MGWTVRAVDHVAFCALNKLLEAAPDIEHPCAGVSLRTSSEDVGCWLCAGRRYRLDDGARQEGDQKSDRVHCCC